MTEQDETGAADDAAGPGAVPLSLTGTTPDRLHLLLVDDQGAEFTLDITPDLRAAVRSETTRVGPLETKMSSSIRPREIQTRIRAGETAEAVAEAAGTTVDAIMPYVAPVLAEREHVAARALKASLRRAPGEGPAAPTQARALGDAVAAHLRSVGADPAADVVWDAYRRETGRWVLTGTYLSAGRNGTARFTYDAPGNYALSDNDDARWLVGEVLPEPVAPARDDLQQARERRLAAVPAEELPLGGEAADEELPLGTSGSMAGSTSDSMAGSTSGSTGSTSLESGYEAAAYDIDQALDLPVPAVQDEPIRATADEQAEASRAAEAERAKHRRPVQKKRGRASVPSWDEIMFGGGDQ